MGSVSFKLGAAFVLVALVAVGGMGTYAYSWARRSAIEHELNNLQVLSRELGSRIDLSLATGKDLADHLANTQNVQDYLASSGREEKAQATFLQWLDLQQGRTKNLSAVFVMS